HKARAHVPDPRSTHPAILAVKSILNRYPNRALWDDLIATLGAEPDAARLKNCHKEWARRGYNPDGMAWALDWYRDGIPERSNGHGKHGRSQSSSEHDHARAGSGRAR